MRLPVLTPSPRELRQFAGGCLFFGALFGTVLWFRGDPRAAMAAWAIGGALGVSGLFVPATLRWIYVGLMVIVAPVGVVVATVVLFAIYWVVITPVAVVQRLGGRDALQRRPPPGDGPASYWVDLDTDADASVERYFRQF